MAKKTFVVWFDVVETHKAYFVADSEEQALEMLKQVNGYDLNVDDLPEVFVKNKGIEVEVDLNSIEEVR